LIGSRCDNTGTCLAGIDFVDAGGVERFASDGSRAALMRSLLALGVTPDRIRWHLARPGSSMGIVY
jgi:hypothetical protein